MASSECNSWIISPKLEELSFLGESLAWNGFTLLRAAASGIIRNSH